MDSESFYSGFSRIDITPAPGEPLMGHLREKFDADGTHDPLFCKAFAFRSGEDAPVCLISLDLCMISESLADDMRSGIEERTGVPGERIMIAATHTHAGPATFSLYGAPSAGDPYLENLRYLTAECCDAAVNDLAPASLEYGQSQVPGIAFYRRLDTGNGTVRMNWEEPEITAGLTPLRQPDETVRVLRIGRKSDEGILVNFPLHPAILDYDNHQYSADFPGVMSKRIESARNKGTRSIFFNGFCGNINHLSPADIQAPRKGYAAVNRAGEALAAGVLEALDLAEPVKTDPVRIEVFRTALKRIEIIGADDPENSGSVSDTGGSDGLPPDIAETFRRELAAVQNEALDVEYQILRIGPIAIAAFPGEIFTELEARLRSRFAVRHPEVRLLCFELANGAIGYIPHQEAYAQGGYEVIPGVTRIAPGGGEALMDASEEALSRLF